jgi:hypothetical protein
MRLTILLPVRRLTMDADGVTLTRTVERWCPSAIGRPGPSEGLSSCGDRATAPIEGIWCKKIRRCASNVRYALIATKFRNAAILRLRRIRHE